MWCPRYRAAIISHSGSSCGAVELTIDAVRSLKPSPLSSSRFLSAAPSSSAVLVLTVANRQCSTRSVPEKVPKWVWVLPTSTTRSTAGECTQRSARGEHRLAAGELQRLDPAGGPAARRRRVAPREVE